MARLYLSGFADEISPSFSVQLQALQDLHVSHIELRGIDQTNVSDLSPQQLREVKAALSAAGIGVSSIGSPIGKIAITDSFAPHMEKLKRTLEIQKELGAPYLRMFSFYLPQDRPAADFRGQVLERLASMAGEAARWDAMLLHENEKGIYGDTAPRCLDLLEHLASPHLRAVFDFANFVEVGQDTLAAYQMLRPFIEYIHIKDCAVQEGPAGRTTKIVPAGQGEGHIPEILTSLVTGGWQGFLSLEPHLVDFAGLAALEQDPAKRDSALDGRTAWELALDALRAVIGQVSAQTGEVLL